MKTHRLLGFAALGGLLALGLTACDDANTVNRPAAPVVLTGAQVPALIGKAPGKVVAFRFNRVGKSPVWTQVPVQVDQRKVVGFGTAPGSNATAGVVGTVYGNGSTGPTALQYADPDTFVGADTDPNVDANDEIVFMAFDGGGRAQGDDRGQPAGVVSGSGIAVQVSDPRGQNEKGWVYLYVASGSLDPSAGKDYVDYDFALVSGAYATTYKRADGPNPETSKVVTPTYEMAFPDRWMESTWKVRAAGATGVDILDGHKNQFATTTCGRSNATFADAEGAFVANIDGPVRAIRSYVGANSGPLTQRTHLMYRDREDVITDLRVHEIPSIMDFIDYSSAATGMTYRSSVVPDGVTIDGVSDAVGNALPSWEAVDGPQGRVYTKSSFTSSSSSVLAGATGFYRDQVSPTEVQCWGDTSYYGASGTYIQASIPNTDPATTATPATLRGTRITQFAAPAADPAKVAAFAADWAADLDQPLTVSVSAYTA